MSCRRVRESVFASVISSDIAMANSRQRAKMPEIEGRSPKPGNAGRGCLYREFRRFPAVPDSRLRESLSANFSPTPFEILNVYAAVLLLSSEG